MMRRLIYQILHVPVLQHKLSQFRNTCLDLYLRKVTEHPLFQSSNQNLLHDNYQRISGVYLRGLRQLDRFLEVSEPKIVINKIRILL